MLRWADECIAKQSVRLYHKANSPRGSDYARTMTVKPGAMETQEEHARDTNYAQSGLVEKVGQIDGGHQLMSRTLETDWGCGSHSCSIDNRTMNQTK